MRRVAITGMGVVSAIGCDPERFFENLVTCRSGVGTITQFDSSSLPIPIAAEVKDFDAHSSLTAKELDHLDRFAQFALVAAQHAVQDAQLNLSEADSLRTGVCVGSGMGGAQAIEVGYSQLFEKKSTRIPPLTITKFMPNAAASHLSMKFGLRGPSACVATACSSASHAIGLGLQWIRDNQADRMMVGGSEACLTQGVMRAWEAMRVLARGGSHPARACRPFSADREGLVLGEGAGILVLEEMEHAKKRGAKIYAELAGFGATSDAGHITHPNVDGAARAMERALADARLNREDIDYINAHGTATWINDLNETRAIKKIFGDQTRVVVTSTKALHGHCLGASGALELVATVLAMKKI